MHLFCCLSHSVMEKTKNDSFYLVCQRTFSVSEPQAIFVLLYYKTLKTEHWVNMIVTCCHFIKMNT